MHLVGSETLATVLYDRIRGDVLAGLLAPGKKLAIDFLCDRYAAGTTPVREALNRLTSEGLVERREQRGFAVTPISRDELDEILKTRCWAEEKALRESVANRTPDWEERLLIASHRLIQVRRFASDDGQENPEWPALHKHFHDTLIGNCGSRPLIGFCQQLADRLYRYRQLAARRNPARRDRDEHQAIVQAVLYGRVDDAVELLNAHYRRTGDVILSNEQLFAGSAA